MFPSTSSTLVNAQATLFIPGATHYHVERSPFFVHLPLEIRQRIYGKVWSDSPTINLGGLRCIFKQNSDGRPLTQRREPGVLEFEDFSPPNAAKYPMWFMACKLFYLESLSEAHRIGIANFEPRRAVVSLDEPRDSADIEACTVPQVMRILYSAPEFNPWLFRRFKIQDFLRTEEWIRPGSRECVVLVSFTSLQELQILPFVPALRAPRVQFLEFRLLIEVLPASSTEFYQSYSFNFASLEWLSLPTIREVRVSLDFVRNANKRAHRRCPRTKRLEWTKRTKQAAAKETERLAHVILERNGQAPTWERTSAPDDVVQESWLLTMQKTPL